MISVNIRGLVAALKSMPNEPLQEELGIGSYRGDYCDLAVGLGYSGWEEEGCRGVAKTTHGLAALLSGAVGSTFTGYKGGEYRMSEWTEVRIADYGTTLSSAAPWLTQVLVRALYGEVSQ